MIQPISTPRIPRPRPDIKKLWDKGKLPEVQYGFYGERLTHKNLSREHLKPASQGGKTKLNNIVLTSKKANNLRGDTNLIKVFNEEAAKQYLKQFENVELPELNGKSYIQAILNTLQKLGIQFGKQKPL